MAEFSAFREGGGNTPPAGPALERVVVRGLQAAIDSQVTRGVVAVQLVAMLHAVLERLIREGRAEIRVRAGVITVNGSAANGSTEDRPVAARLIELFEERRLAGIDVTQGITVDELTDAFHALAHLDNQQIGSALARAGVKHVTLHRDEMVAAAAAPAVGGATPPHVASVWHEHGRRAEPRGLGLGVHRALARNAYAQLITAARTWYAVGDVSGSVSDDAARRLRYTKRAVQRVIDLMHEDDACIVGLACTGAGGRDVSAHSARVCVLALAVARQAGHARGELQTVALAALLHDVGVAAPAPGLEHTSGAPVALRGAARLLEDLPADTAAPAALAALAQGAGAAAAAPPSGSSALARLVRIADLYDQLIQRTASQAAARPDAALHFVFQHGARAIDAALARCFAAVLGVFPPGSVVQLDSGDTAVVVRANHASVDRPQVLLVRDASGARLDGSVCIDLAVRRSGGLPAPAIVTPLDAAETDIDPLECFLTEPVQR